jgi:hypothetical protein
VSAEAVVVVESVSDPDFEFEESHRVNAIMHIKPRKMQAIFFIVLILIF